MSEPVKRKVVAGSDMHMSLLMAPHGLNLVVGDDRATLLRFAADVWEAAKRADKFAQTETEPTETSAAVASMIKQAGDAGMLVEVVESFGGYRASGDTTASAAWCALYDWDI